MSPPSTPSPPLPRVSTPLTAEQILDRLSTASKRGRMPGFQRGEGGSFSVAAFGQPFDGRLNASLDDEKLTFSIRMLSKLPVIFGVVLLLTIWPGVYLTDQLIPGEWGWIPTWWWYLPITVLPIPWIWRGLMRKSRATMHASALEAIAKIAAEVDGQVVEQPAS